MKTKLILNWTTIFVVFTIIFNLNSLDAGDQSIVRAKPAPFAKLKHKMQERRALKAPNVQEVANRSASTNSAGRNPSCRPSCQPKRPELICAEVPERPPLIYAEVPPRPAPQLIYAEVPPRPVQQLIYAEVPPRPAPQLIYAEVPPRPVQQLIYAEVPPRPAPQLIYAEVPPRPVQQLIYAEVPSRRPVVRYIYDCPPQPVCHEANRQHVAVRTHNLHHRVHYVQNVQQPVFVGGFPQQMGFTNHCGAQPGFAPQGWGWNHAHQQWGQGQWGQQWSTPTQVYSRPYHNPHDPSGYGWGQHVAQNAYAIGYNIGTSNYDRAIGRWGHRVW
jgi:hypothetical protein